MDDIQQVGFPIGYYDKDKIFYLYNHLDFYIQYHQESGGVEGEEHSYRIVQFEVYPQSLMTDSMEKTGEDGKVTTEFRPQCLNPELSKMQNPAPQLLEPGMISFSYNVIFS